MTRQKSDRRVVAQGTRKFAPTQTTGGAKATTVTKETRQLDMRFGTAENQGKILPRAIGGMATHQKVAVPCVVLKPNHKREIGPSTKMVSGFHRKRHGATSTMGENPSGS